MLRAKKLAKTKTSEEEPAAHKLKTSQGKEEREGERPESERNDQVIAIFIISLLFFYY